MMDSGWTVPFILREQTVNLTERFPEDVLSYAINDTYLEAILETARHPQNGNLHALPLFPDLGFTLYREDLIEDAGYDTSGWGLIHLAGRSSRTRSEMRGTEPTSTTDSRRRRPPTRGCRVVRSTR